MFVCMRKRDRHPGGRQTKPLGAILSKNFVKGWQGSESERCSNAHEGEESKCTISHFFLVSQLFFPEIDHNIKFYLNDRKLVSGYLISTFSCSVMSDPLWPHELQHARPPCPSPTPGIHPNSCPSSRWCHPAISSSVVPFSSCPQSLSASESFPMSQLFASGGQSTGVSALASFLPKNTQDWSPLEWTGWISLQSKGLSRVFSNITVQKHQFFGAQLSL